MSNPLRFSSNGLAHEISLIPTERDSLHSAVIGGIKYSIRGREEAIALFEKKTRGLNLASMELEELQNRLSIVDAGNKIPHIDKIKDAIANVLIPRIQKKSMVLSELTPSWPIPGKPACASLSDRMHALGVPGARVAVVNHWKAEWSEGLGELEQPGMMVQAASISKTITCLTVMSLIQEGVKTPKGDFLTLDTNVQDIVSPELWNSISGSQQDQPITIRQLMSHTAGLEPDTSIGYRGYYRESTSEIAKTDEQISELEKQVEDIENSEMSTPDKEKQIAEVEQRIANLKMARERAAEGRLPNLDEILKGEATNSPPVRATTKPGSHYDYAGGGSMILQKVIEVIAQHNDLPNKTYEAIVKEKIFDKLGMTNSTFSPEDSQTVQGNGEDGHPLVGGKWVQQPELAAAGLWSTPEDLAKVAIGIQKSLTNQEGRLLEPALAREMLTPPSGLELQPNEIPGLGVFVTTTSEGTFFYHSGSNLGFRCLMIANDQGQGVVIMTNAELGDELIPEIVRKVADVYDWKGKNTLTMLPPLHDEVIKTSKNSLEVDAKKWAEKYQGKYVNDRHQDAVVSVEVNEANGKIYFKTPNPAQAPIEIIPVSKHVGIVKENGRWFPVEFTNNEDNALSLNIHGMKHTKLNQQE